MSTPNYLTRRGANRIQAEIRELRGVERPRIVQEVADAAAQGDRSENAEYIYGKKRLREIDRRLRFLIKRLDAAEIVPARTDGTERIYFGARVELETESGDERIVRIVGEDEIDLDRGDISWRSPLGRALLGKEPGDTVRVRRPDGMLGFEIVAVSYPADDGP